METPGILAIDFGTTNSYFCKCPADQISPVGVDFGTGRDGLPTAILYRDEREPLVGDSALHEYGEASGMSFVVFVSNRPRPSLAITIRPALTAQTRS